MSEIAWFTLLLRAAGLLIVAQMSPGFVGYIGYATTTLADQSYGMSLSIQVPIFATLLGYGAAIGFGVYLLFGGRRVVRFCVRDLVARCAVCGYPLTKITGPVCPECGVPVRKEPTPVEESRSGQESS